VVMDTDFIGSCNSNYNTITTMTDPLPGIGMINWVIHVTVTYIPVVIHCVRRAWRYQRGNTNLLFDNKNNVYKMYYNTVSYVSLFNIATRGAGTAYPFGAPSLPPLFSGVHVTRSLVLCDVLCRPLFVLLPFFCWSLCCLFFE
jgi:hypothetical protein